MDNEKIKALAREYWDKEWRPIDGYSGYFISSDGYVLSLKGAKGRILKPCVYRDGYKTVSLTRDDGTPKTLKIHRLVAQAFIPNPYNFPCVNHKDECKQNNHVENLEWCNHKYNNTYGTVTFRRSRTMTNSLKISTPVGAYNQYGEVVAIFPSAMEAGRLLRFSHTAISAAIKGERNHHKGLEWKELKTNETLESLFDKELFNTI